MARIYIESSSFYGKRSGVGRYGLSVSEQLMRQRTHDWFTLFSFLRPGRKLGLDIALPGNVKRLFIRWFPGRIFSFLMRYGFSIPLELFGMWRADVLIFPNFIAWASLLNKPRISVVHDIAFAFYPEYIQAKNLAYLRRQLPKSLERSNAIVAVSEATKQDLIQHYDVPKDKISVVYNAVDHAVFNPEAAKQTPAVLRRYHLPQKYLLFVGNIEPRKNLEGLLRAYAESYSDHHLALVIVGARGWNDSGIEQRLHELSGLPIYRTDFVTDNDLSALYAGAVMFVYPSFYEGFGIPCLEAMASGCPVICSNVSSLPEVVGDAALQINPNDTAEITQAITRLAKSSTLRRKLAAAGTAQAKQFTWEASARALSKVIDSLQ